MSDVTKKVSIAAAVAVLVLALGACDEGVTVIERGVECRDAGGRWYWRSDWVGYVCEFEAASE